MKKIYFFCVTLASTVNLYSQDIAVLNENQPLLFVNPSFAGSNGGIRNQFVYTNTWPELSSNYISYSNCLDAYVKALHGGLAVSAARQVENYGTYATSEYHLVYAPIFKCPESGIKVIPSIQAGYIKRTIDLSASNFQYTYIQNGSFVIPSSEKSNFDASAGLLINYKGLYIGGSVFHINQPDLGLYGTLRLPAKYSFNASYNILAGTNAQLNFSTRYTMQQKYHLISGAVNALFYKHIVLGMGCNYDDMLFTNFGFRHNYFTVVGGYSLLYSRISDATANAWQVSASFNLRNKEQRKLITNFESW